MKPSTFSIRPSTEDSLRSSTVVLCPCTACRRQTKVLSETARSLPPAILKTKFVPRVFSVFNMAAHVFLFWREISRDRLYDFSLSTSDFWLRTKIKLPSNFFDFIFTLQKTSKAINRPESSAVIRSPYVSSLF